jgi:hypothetical protein
MQSLQKIDITEENVGLDEKNKLCARHQNTHL